MAASVLVVVVERETANDSVTVDVLVLLNVMV